ncbi:MAG: crAss001_48 related protein [Cetobacterium sp.]
MTDKHIERMELELTELNKKYDGLTAFLNAELVYPKLTDSTQREYLVTQWKLMSEYVDILKKRIAYDSEKVVR